MISMKKVHNKLGFTLIEVMMVVAVVGILAAIAYPSYVDYVTRANRAEALRELARIANLQEQFFIDTRNYTGDLSQLGVSNGATFETESKKYLIEVVNFDVNSGDFLLRATAKGTQAYSDSDCNWIAISNTGQKTAESAECWE